MDISDVKYKKDDGGMGVTDFYLIYLSSDDGVSISSL
jgi:hypothetical protein